MITGLVSTSPYFFRLYQPNTLMKYIFTLLLFYSFRTDAQFNEIVNRLLSDKPVHLELGKIRCGLCFGMKGIWGSPLLDIPSVRRPMDEQGLRLRRPDAGILTDTTNKIRAKATVAKPCRVMIRCEATPLPDNPLLVVDGMLMDSFSHLRNIPVNEIKEINILKDAAASALYGYRAARGVVLVTTQSTIRRTLIIRDAENNVPVSRATIRFVAANLKDTLLFVANDSGRLVTDRLQKDIPYEVLVTATGYQSIKRTYENRYSQNNTENWDLQRNFVCNEEAVIVRYVDWKKSRICCGGGRVLRCVLNLSVPESETMSVSLYPNPARAGQTLTLKKEMPKEEVVALLLFNGGGQLIRSEHYKAIRGLNRFLFTTHSGWPGGTYFYRLVYAKGQVLASGKIIIQ